MKPSQEVTAFLSPEGGPRGPGPRAAGEISLRKLQIFWAIAHTDSLTRAAKLLGVSQPSLSQQLGALEAAIGAKLFDRLSNTLVLTEIGAALLPKAEHVLRSMQEFEDSLPHADGGMRQTIRIAGVSSVMRMILPNSLRHLRQTHPLIEFDMHEAAPAEILDLLHGRRIHLGLVAANTVAETSAGFRQHLLAVDPYVLVVPTAIDLGRVSEPDADLGAAERDLLHSVIQFVFGNQHSRRVEDWYDAVLPGNRVTVRARSFELALEMVRSGLGVCVAPALSALHGAGQLDGIRLYRTDLEPRRIVAMLPAHCAHQEPYPQLLASLQQAGGDLPLPAILDMPPFVARHASRRAGADSASLSTP